MPPCIVDGCSSCNATRIDALRGFAARSERESWLRQYRALVVASLEVDMQPCSSALESRHTRCRPLQTRRPVARFTVLMSNGVDLRPGLLVGLVDDRVRETIELVDPHTGFAMRAAKLVSMSKSRTRSNSARNASATDRLACSA
jgi:hypothetical protein